MPRVHLFADDDTSVGPQFPIELIGADIDCIHPHSTALQQAISESASRSTNVDADLASGVDAKVIEGCFELQPTAADVAELLSQLNRSIANNCLSRLLRLLPVDRDLAGEDERLRLLAGLDKSTVDQQLVDALL